MIIPDVYYSPRLKTWVLGEDYQTQVNGSILCIKAGFRFDMASVPRVFAPMIQAFELGTVGPLKHDLCYQASGVLEDAYPPVTLTRRKVDFAFKADMILEGVCKWRRVPAFWAVRMFGWAAWCRKRRVPVRPVRR